MLDSSGTVHCNATIITNSSTTGYSSYDLAVDGNDVVHIVYQGYNTGSWEEYYRNITPSQYLMCG